MIELIKDGVSGELKKTRRWVLWQLEDVQDGAKLRKNAKVPKDARTGENASHSDPATWSTYEEVIQAHESQIKLQPDKNSVAVHPVRGIGLVIGPPFFGIDLDDCRNPETGEITRDAKEWIDELDSLTEISPSGTGAHIWCHGEPPYKEGHRKDGREIYSANRYLTITGQILFGRNEIRRFTREEVKKWYDRVKHGNTKTERTSSHTSAKLADLMAATDYADASQHVQSLLTTLAIEHLCDAAKVEEEFKKSAVYLNTHWETEKWERLREKELKKALEYARENIAKRLAREPDVELEIAVSDGDKVTPERTVWLWPGWLSRGDLHGSFGDSKEGKSPVWCDLAAVLTRGRDFPDGTKNTNGPVNVALCNCEDNFARKTLLRFLAAGGDPTRLVHIDGVRPKGSSLRARVIALDESKELIRQYLRDQKEKGREFALLVFDPITSMLGKMKYTDHQQTRRVMDPLADLATEFNLAVVIVNHFNRNTETSAPQYRVLGGGLYQVCRQVLLHTRPEDANPDQEGDRYRHVLSEDRNQEVDSVEYSTVKEKFSHCGEEYEVIRIRWGKKLDVKSDGLMEQVSHQDKGLYARLARELKNFLNAGARPASDCIRFLESGFPEIKDRKGFKWDRVRRQAGIETAKNGKANQWCIASARDEMQMPLGRQSNDGPSF